MSGVIIGWQKLEEHVGLERHAIRRLIRKGAIPPPRKPSEQMCIWIQDEIIASLRKLPTEPCGGREAE